MFLCAVIVQAKDKDVPASKDAPAFHYIDPTSIDLKTLLPDPPATGSPENDKEIQVVLEKQKTRTPIDVARAESEVKFNVFIFTKTIGPWFTTESLPLTTTLFQNVNEDAHLVVDPARKIWNRPRPPLQDKAIKPAIDLEDSGSYPSGHAARGFLMALILASLDPDRKSEVIARGKLIGDDRVMAGVHFPSDITAGETLAGVIYAKLMANPAFQADYAKAKAEFEDAHAKSLAPTAN